jgi:hypothetical protein
MVRNFAATIAGRLPGPHWVARWIKAHSEELKRWLSVRLFWWDRRKELLYLPEKKWMSIYVHWAHLAA